MIRMQRIYNPTVVFLVIVGCASFVNHEVLDTALLGFDPYAAILSSRIENPADLAGTFTERLMDGRLAELEFYRPVGNLFLALDFAVWKLDPFGYQLTSLALWAATVAMLYRLTRKILGARARLGPAIATTFYALHPAALSVIPFPSRQTDILAILFIALAIELLPTTPRVASAWKRHLAAGTLALLAIGSKESGVIAVLLIFAHQAQLGVGGNLRERFQYGFRAAAPAAALALGFLVARCAVIGGMGGYKIRSEQSLFDAFSEFSPQYLSTIFATGSLDTPSLRTLTTGLCLAAMLWLTVALFRARSAEGTGDRINNATSLLSLGIGWLVVQLAVVTLSIHFSPRYMMPMIFATSMALGALGEGAYLRWRASHGSSRWRSLTTAFALLIIGVAGLHGSPLFRSYPGLLEATEFQEQQLDDLRAWIESRRPRASTNLSLRRRVHIEAAAVDDAFLMAPWSLQAWLDIEYPDRDLEVQVRPRGEPSRTVWKVLLTPRSTSGS